MLPVSDLAVENIHIICSSRHRQKEYLPNLMTTANALSIECIEYIKHLVNQRPDIKQCKPITFTLHGVTNQHESLLRQLRDLIPNKHTIRIADSDLILPDIVNQLQLTYVIETDCSTKYGEEYIASPICQLYDNVIVHCTIHKENQDYYVARDYIKSFLSEAKIEFSLCSNPHYLPDTTDEYAKSIQRVCDAIADASIKCETLEFEESIVYKAMERYNQAYHYQTYDLYPNCGLSHRMTTIDLNGHYYICNKIIQQLAPNTITHYRLLLATDDLVNMAYQLKSECNECEYLVLCRGGCPFQYDQRHCNMLKVYFKAVMSILARMNAQLTEIEL